MNFYAPLNQHVYLITHKPSGLLYVGVHALHARIRFEEHLHGFGSKMIYELVLAGATREDFTLEILGSYKDADEACAAETHFVHLYNTKFPNGMNVERASSSYQKMLQMLEEYSSNGFDASIITSHLVYNYWKNPPNTPIQNQIETLAHFQTINNVPSEKEWRQIRGKLSHSCAMKNAIAEGTSGFREGRKKLKQRMAMGVFTEAELAAQASRSESTSRAWSERSAEERVEILKNATTAAAISNTKNKPKDFLSFDE